MKKTSAVEWLYEVFYGTDTFNQEEVLKQAKEMEKQQIIDAAKWMPKPFENIEFIDELGNQYYNETFNNK